MGKVGKPPKFDKAMKRYHIVIPDVVLANTQIIASATGGTLQGTLRELISDGAKHRLDALKTEPR